METTLDISGNIARAIHLACMEFKKKNLNLIEYELTVVETPNLFEISFHHKSAEPVLRGAPKNHPGVNVKIDKLNFNVVEVYFTR